MEAEELEEIFTKVHHVSLIPGDRFGEVKGRLGLVYHEPYLEDAILFWGELLSYKGFDKAVIIDRTSIDSINLALLIDKEEDEALVLIANKLRCDPVRLDLFLKNHPPQAGLNLALKISTSNIEEAMGFDASLGINKSIWVDKWKGMG